MFRRSANAQLRPLARLQFQRQRLGILLEKLALGIGHRPIGVQIFFGMHVCLRTPSDTAHRSPTHLCLCPSFPPQMPRHRSQATSNVFALRDSTQPSCKVPRRERPRPARRGGGRLQVVFSRTQSGAAAKWPTGAPAESGTTDHSQLTLQQVASRKPNRTESRLKDQST